MIEMEDFCRNFLKKFEGKKLEEIVLGSEDKRFIYKGFYKEDNKTKKVIDRESRPPLPRSDYHLLSRRAGYLMGILARVGVDTCRDKDSEKKIAPVVIPIYIIPEGENQEYKPLVFG